MKFVTREKPKVDRVACPWLIKRFIEADAELLFVPADQVMATAERENALPYDVPNAELGHQDGGSSFESFIRKYNLTTRPCWNWRKSCARRIHRITVRRRKAKGCAKSPMAGICWIGRSKKGWNLALVSMTACMPFVRNG